MGGLDRFIRKGDKVLIKPNLLAAKEPEKACTTHPEFLRAVIQLVKKAGGLPSVGDSPAFNTLSNVAKASGIKRVCREENIPLVTFRHTTLIKNPSGRMVKTFPVAREILAFDSIISLPKLKNHSLTHITVAVKNLFGVIPGMIKQTFHFRFQDSFHFSQMLIDLNRIIKPALNIVDGIMGMEGEGPNTGLPKRTGVIISGTDTVSVDYISSIIMNYDPQHIEVIKAAKISGFGGYEPSMIEVKGDDLRSLIDRTFKTITPGVGRGILSKIFPLLNRNFLRKKPVIDRIKCAACEECIRICPAKTIFLVDGKARIEQKKCIKCYCCHEICRYKAVRLTYF